MQTINLVLPKGFAHSLHIEGAANGKLSVNDIMSYDITSDPCDIDFAAELQKGWENEKTLYAIDTGKADPQLEYVVPKPTMWEATCFIINHIPGAYTPAKMPAFMKQVEESLQKTDQLPIKLRGLNLNRTKSLSLYVPAGAQVTYKFEMVADNMDLSH